MSGKPFALLCIAMIAAAVGAIVAIVLVSTPSYPLAPRVALVATDDPYDLEFVRGASAAAIARGMEIEICRVEAGQGTSNDLFEHLISPDVFGVVASRGVIEHAPCAVRRLVERTKVVTCGEDVWPASRLCHVGTGDFSSGRVCAKAAMSALDNVGRVLLLVDDVSDGAGAIRLDGFHQQLREKNFGLVVVATLADAGDSVRCARQLRQALSEHAELDLVIDLGDRPRTFNSLALAAIVSEMNGQLITFDRSEAVNAEFGAGRIYAVIGDDAFQQGYQAVTRLASFYREGELSFPAPGRGQVHVPALVVRQQQRVALRSRPRSARNASANWAAM